MRTGAAFLCLLLVMGTACDEPAGVPLSTAAEPTSTSFQATTTTTEPGAPNCTASAVQALVEGFVDAYNSGAPKVADRFFAPEPAFEWYAENPTRLRGDSMDRSTLATYLAGRYQEGHRFQLTSFEFTGYRAVDHTGHFTFATAGAGTKTLHGKGAVECSAGLLMVWAF